VLSGTTRVEVSELMSRMLSGKNISHNVLNAKQHARERRSVPTRARPGTVTHRHQHGGRGTDIKLGPGVKEAGGLAIVGTEKAREPPCGPQLRGRVGRQGDPGHRSSTSRWRTT
jgi:preprotein translocase subunit SecA